MTVLMSKDVETLPLLNNYIEHWASETPQSIAMVQHEDGKQLTYQQFASYIDLFALRLLSAGFKKGDRLATQLPLIPEHVIFMYACFKIGVIIAPLDLRLKPDEVVRDINKIKPRAFFCLGQTAVMDFSKNGEAVLSSCPSVQLLVQFLPEEQKNDVIKGAIAITDFLAKTRLLLLKVTDVFTQQLKKTYKQVTAKTDALIIYTTGTTGEPKPALLCHENILVQNQILLAGIPDFATEKNTPLITMVNLPPSHVGCVTETLMTTFFRGGKAVLLRIFDVQATLEGIEKHKVSLLGQIPTQFRMLWSHPDYEKFDLTSLQCVVYAGAAGDLPFLQRLAKMAPSFGTGLGMTENAGFATFTPAGISPEAMVGQVGRDFPELAKVTVRLPMNADGSAGDELPMGDTGEICYHPPVVFSGYFNMPEETRKAISNEGILYTGDLGYFKSVDEHKALFLSGRRKFIIKQKGYNVFPTEVEDHIKRLPGIAEAEVVGVKHKLFDEGIFVFVKLLKNNDLTVEQIYQHCKEIASYKRPQHIEIWPMEESFPLTRSTKVDKLILQKQASKRVEELRKKEEWDAHN